MAELDENLSGSSKKRASGFMEELEENPSKRQKTGALPPGPRASFRTPTTMAEIVQVLIGKEKVSFAVQKSFLVHHSTYFRSALLNNSFEEARTKVIELDHTTPEAFGLYVEVLYTSHIDNSNLPSHRTLLELWILADYLGTPFIQDVAMSQIIADRSIPVEDPCHPLNWELDFVYENTSHGSVLRKAVIYICHKFGYDRGFFGDHRGNFTGEIVEDLCDSFIVFDRDDFENDEHPMHKLSSYLGSKDQTPVSEEGAPVSNTE